MARPTRRRDTSQVDSDSTYVTRSIQAGKLVERSTWGYGVFRAVFIPVPFIMFTWACIDFLPEINAMNVFLCALTTLVIVIVLVRIPQHLVRRTKLVLIQTGLSRAENQRIAVAACEALRWRIIRSNRYLLIAAPNPENYTRTYKLAAQLATIMFDERSQYVHVGTKKADGDETVVLNLDRRATKNLIEAIRKRL